MKTITINAQEHAIIPILKLLQPFGTSIAVKLFEESPLPSLEEQAAKDFEKLAQRIVVAIRPTPKQPMRQEALEFALKGGDTFIAGAIDIHSNGDPALRNALGALSKAMRPIFQWEQSPIDRIALRVKQFHKNSGAYLGTSYRVTPLGARVRELLVEQGVLK